MFADLNFTILGDPGYLFEMRSGENASAAMSQQLDATYAPLLAIAAAICATADENSSLRQAVALLKKGSQSESWSAFALAAGGSIAPIDIKRCGASQRGAGKQARCQVRYCRRDRAAKIGIDGCHSGGGRGEGRREGLRKRTTQRDQRDRRGGRSGLTRARP